MEMLSLRDLCEHLRLEDERRALAAAARFGLAPRARFGSKDHYRFMWDNVLRFIHGIEPLAHRDISDELRQPLLHFADIAALIRKTSEALRKDVSRGKVNLPPHPSDRPHPRLASPRHRGLGRGASAACLCGVHTRIRRGAGFASRSG